MDNKALAEFALAHGWSADQRSFYDGEGVEGWHWESPSGEEFEVLGAWEDGPAIDENLRSAMLQFMESQNT